MIMKSKIWKTSHILATTARTTGRTSSVAHNTCITCATSLSMTFWQFLKFLLRFSYGTWEGKEIGDTGYCTNLYVNLIHEMFIIWLARRGKHSFARARMQASRYYVRGKSQHALRYLLACMRAPAKLCFARLASQALPKKIAQVEVVV